MTPGHLQASVHITFLQAVKTAFLDAATHSHDEETAGTTCLATE
jgi:hypothetical protein